MKLPSRKYYSIWKDFLCNPFIIFCAVGFVAVHCLFVVFYYQTPDFFKKINVEDGPMENGSAIFYLLGAVFFVFVVARSKHWLSRTWAILFALAFFVLAGEEVSWGQRLFDYHVEAVEEINSQGEFNIHNLEQFHAHQWLNAPRLLTMGSLAFGIILPVMLTLSKWFQNLLVDTLRFPIPHAVIGICFFLSWMWYRNFYGYGADDSMLIAVEESRETTIALGFCLYAFIIFITNSDSSSRENAARTEIVGG